MQVIYGVNAAYVLPALVSIYSLHKHASQPVTVTLYVDGITEQHWEAIQRITQACAFDIQVKEFNPTGLENHYANPCFPAVRLLPLLLPALETGRCLFLDADTLVREDIWDLLSANLNGQALGACLDIDQVVYRERRILHSRLSDVLRPTSTRLEKLRYLERVAKLGFVPHENYFNAGVLVMDCDVIRQEYPQYTELPCPDKLRPFQNFPDQDPLNAFFAGRWCLLPLRWNVRPGIKRDVEYRPYRFRHVSSTLWQQLRDATTDPKLWHFVRTGGIGNRWERE